MKQILVLFLVCFVNVTFSRKLPSYIEVCKPKEVDVPACIMKNVEMLRPKLSKGIPEMLLPSIDPLVLPLAKLQVGDFSAQIKDIKLWHLPEFKLSNLTMDLDKLNMELVLDFPRVDVEGEYTIKGKLLVLQLDGTGPLELNITRLHVKVAATGERGDIKGKEHILTTGVKIVPTIGDIHINLQNLFPKNPELTDNANKLLNENQKVLLEEFSPLIINVLEEFIFASVKNVFARYPFNVLFPGA